MNRNRHHIPTTDRDALDQYWNQLVQADLGANMPVPAATNPLTTFVHFAQQTVSAEQHMPTYRHRLVRHLLAAQQEQSNMTVQSVALVPPIDLVPLPPITLRSNRGLKWSWAALLALFVISAIIIGQFSFNRKPDNGPVIMAPTAQSTPTAGAPEATPTPSESTSSEFVNITWKVATGADSLYSPYGLAIAPDGNIWVADSGRNQYRIYSPDGSLLETWGEGGSGDGQFNFSRAQSGFTDSISAIAFAPDGSFYITDTGNNRVQKFGPDRTYQLAFGSRGGGAGQFIDIVGVAVSSDGSVFVIDDRRYDVQRFSVDGAFEKQIVGSGSDPGQVTFPGQIHIDADDNLWIADYWNYRIQKLDLNGEIISGFGTIGNSPGSFNGPNDVATDQNGNIFVADTDEGRIEVFEPDGRYFRQWNLSEEDQFYPIGIAVADDGAVYAVSGESGELIKFAVSLDEPKSMTQIPGLIGPNTGLTAPFSGSSGSFAAFQWQTSTTQSALINPGSITLAPNGTMWVPDLDADVIHIFSTDGDYLSSWGEPGTEPGQFEFMPKNFDAPYNRAVRANAAQIIFLADGSFAVSDAGNMRVQLFAADRTFITQFGDKSSGDGVIYQYGHMFPLPNDQIGIVDLAQVVADKFTLVVFDHNGAFVEIRKVTGFAPVAFGSDGDYWAVPAQTDERNADNPLYHYDAAGNILATLSTSPTLESGHRADILFITVGTIDEQGRLWLTNAWTGEALVADPNGTILITWNGNDAPGGQFVFPAWIAIDGAGSAYVVDASTFTITAHTITLATKSATPVP